LDALEKLNHELQPDPVHSLSTAWPPGVAGRIVTMVTFLNEFEDELRKTWLVLDETVS
jgi:hypothetical protein